MRRQQIPCLMGAVVGTLLTLAACGGTAPPTASGGAGGPAPTATRSTGPASPTAAGGASVDVTLSEYHIDMPQSVPAGTVSFTVANAGSTAHNFEIEGNGVEKTCAANLHPGETKTLQVDLKPGSYEVYCPVDNHKGMGMKLDLKVGR